MNRLEILQNSLINKKANLDVFFEDLYSHQRLTNGQPMNDKRNGGTWFKRHDQLNNKIANQFKEIEKTENAIEREQSKIDNYSDIEKDLPQPILDLIQSGTLVQWKRYPNTFFIQGLDTVRLVYDKKVMKTKIKETLFNRYQNEFKKNCSREQWLKFVKIWNELYPLINKETKV